MKPDGTKPNPAVGVVDRRTEIDDGQQNDRHREDRVTETPQHAIAGDRRQQHDHQGQERIGHLLEQEPATAFGELLDAGDPQPSQSDQQDGGSDDRPRQVSGPNSRFHRIPMTIAHEIRDIATYYVYYGYVNCSVCDFDQASPIHLLSPPETKKRSKLSDFCTLRHRTGLPRLLDFQHRAAIFGLLRPAYLVCSIERE
jgi:hypothetical protein